MVTWRATCRIQAASGCGVYPCNLDLPAAQMDEKDHVIRDQPTERPHLGVKQLVATTASSLGRAGGVRCLALLGAVTFLGSLRCQPRIVSGLTIVATSLRASLPRS